MSILKVFLCWNLYFWIAESLFKFISPNATFRVRIQIHIIKHIIQSSYSNSYHQTTSRLNILSAIIFIIIISLIFDFILGEHSLPIISVFENNHSLLLKTIVYHHYFNTIYFNFMWYTFFMMLLWSNIF